MSAVLAGMVPALTGEGGLMQRRLLPLKSLAVQTSYARSAALVLRSAPGALPLTHELALLLGDVCQVMELDDAQVLQGVGGGYCMLWGLIGRLILYRGLIWGFDMGVYRVYRGYGVVVVARHPHPTTPNQPLPTTTRPFPRQVSAMVTVRGAAVRPEALARLRVGCMELLVAALGWPAFRTADTVEATPREAAVPPVPVPPPAAAKADAAGAAAAAGAPAPAGPPAPKERPPPPPLAVNKLRERILKVRCAALCTLRMVGGRCALGGASECAWHAATFRRAAHQ